MARYFNREAAIILAASITVSDGADRLYDCLDEIYECDEKKHARGAAKRMIKKVMIELENLSEKISKENRFESNKKPNSRRILATKIFNTYTEELIAFEGNMDKGYLAGLPRDLALAMLNLIASNDFLKTRKFTKCGNDIEKVLQYSNKAIKLLEDLYIYNF